MIDRYPDDFNVMGTSGGLVPGSVNRVVEIQSDGSGRFMEYDSGELGPPRQQTTFSVSDTQLEGLWQSVLRVDFFSLDTRYEDGLVVDGVFATLTVTAQGRTHQVDVQNASVPRFDQLLDVINRITPENMDLTYQVRTPNE